MGRQTQVTRTFGIPVVDQLNLIFSVLHVFKVPYQTELIGRSACLTATIFTLLTSGILSQFPNTGFLRNRNRRRRRNTAGTVLLIRYVGFY